MKTITTTQHIVSHITHIGNSWGIHTPEWSFIFISAIINHSAQHKILRQSPAAFSHTVKLSTENSNLLLPVFSSSFKKNAFTNIYKLCRDCICGCISTYKAMSEMQETGTAKSHGLRATVSCHSAAFPFHCSWKSPVWTTKLCLTQNLRVKLQPIEGTIKSGKETIFQTSLRARKVYKIGFEV